MPENRVQQALEEFPTALALDPLSPIMNVNYGLTLMVAHRYPEAIAQIQKVLVAILLFRRQVFIYRGYMQQLAATATP
jgi:predicted Zn-dependent protease